MLCSYFIQRLSVEKTIPKFEATWLPLGPPVNVKKHCVLSKLCRLFWFHISSHSVHNMRLNQRYNSARRSRVSFLHALPSLEYLLANQNTKPLLTTSTTYLFRAIRVCYLDASLSALIGIKGNFEMPPSLIQGRKISSKAC